MLDKYTKTALRGYLCMKYFSIKYIDPSVMESLEIFIKDYCQTKKYKITWIYVGQEATEIIFDYPQTIAVVEIIQGMKNSTSKSIRDTFPETLGKQKSFWINSRSEMRRGYTFVSLNPNENPPTFAEGLRES